MSAGRKKSAYEVQQELKYERRKYSYHAGLAFCFFMTIVGFWVAWIEYTSPSAAAPRKLIGKIFYFVGGSEGIAFLGLLSGSFFFALGVWAYKNGRKVVGK